MAKMRDFSDLIRGVVCKKNLGYRYHRAYVPEGTLFFTKSLDISKSDIEIATSILNTININTKEDMFLGLTCVALLSSYEKRQKAVAEHQGKKLNECMANDNLYYYKGCVNQIIVEALKKNLDFTFCIKEDSKKQEVTYITLGGVQFSFHHGNTSETAKYAMEHNIRQYEDQEWDRNFAFQNGAKEIFEFALHLKNTSELKYIHEKPVEYANSYREEFDIKQDEERENI